MTGYKYRRSMHEEKDGVEVGRLASGETDDVSDQRNQGSRSGPGYPGTDCGTGA